MTNTNVVEANLEKWAEEMKSEEDGADFSLTSAEEISLDERKFTDDRLAKDDWVVIKRKCPECIAFSATSCGLKKVEAPEENSTIEVLDFSENQITDIDFAKKFPNLVSLSIANTHIAKFEQLNNLKDLEKLQIFEFKSDDPNFDVKDDEELHNKVFELVPDLISFNGLDKEGDPVAEFGDLEEEGLFGLEEEGEFDDLEDLEEEDLEEEGEYDDEDLAEDDDDEPPAKRQKTDEA